MAQEFLKDEREEFTLQVREDRDIERWEREPGGHPGRHYHPAALADTIAVYAGHGTVQ
jgi:hypothetical protein